MSLGLVIIRNPKYPKNSVEKPTYKPLSSHQEQNGIQNFKVDKEGLRRDLDSMENAEIVRWYLGTYSQKEIIFIRNL